MSRHLSDDRPIYHCPRNVNFHQALPIPLDLQESAVGYCNTSSVDLQLAVHVCCSPSVQSKQSERMVVTTAELQRNRRELHGLSLVHRLSVLAFPSHAEVWHSNGFMHGSKVNGVSTALPLSFLFQNN